MRLSETVLLVRANCTPTSTWTPPENALASPTALVIVAELPELVLLLIVAVGTLLDR